MGICLLPVSYLGILPVQVYNITEPQHFNVKSGTSSLDNIPQTIARLHRLEASF